MLLQARILALVVLIAAILAPPLASAEETDSQPTTYIIVKGVIFDRNKLNSYGDFGWMGGFGWLVMLLVWALVIALVVLGAGALFRARDRASESTPLEILKRRYAAGES